jgi:parallel beta-helix repeat protein
MVKKILFTSALLMGMAIWSAIPAFSATLIVNPGTSGDSYFGTIQEAIDAAVAGDTILISPLAANQAYNEQVTINTANIILKGLCEVEPPRRGKNKTSNNPCDVDADNLSALAGRADRWDDCCSPVFLDGCDTESCMKTAITVTAPNVTIEKLTIRHAYEGIRLESDADNAVIKNVCFYDCKGAIDGNSTDGVLVSNCLFFGGDYHSIFLYGNNATVSKNRFRSVEKGINIEGDNAVVDANILLSSNSRSIKLTSSDAALVRNNWIEGGNDGVRINGGDGVVVTNNWIKAIDGNGIIVYPESEEAYNPIITNNWIEGARFAGIRVDLYDYSGNGNATIRNNTVKYTMGEGLAVNGRELTSGVIEKNHISFALYDAEGMVIKADNMTIQSNVIEYSSQDGLLCTGDYNTISGNTVRFCGSESREHEPGISIDGSYNTIEKNTVSKNSFDGIRNFGGDNNTYSENIVSQNGMSGICITNSGGNQSENNSIVTNIIESNHGEGINISAGAVGTIISNNTLSRNKTDICNEGTGSTFSGNIYDTGGPDCDCVVR